MLAHTMSSLRDHAHETRLCTFCPKLCRFSCPIDRVEHDEAVTPTGKQTALYLLDKGTLEWTADTASVFYKCTGCRIQQTFCDHRVDVTPVFRAAREETVRRGLEPAPIRDLRDRMARDGHPHGSDAIQMGAVVNRVLSIAPSPSDDIYFASCTALAKRPEAVVDFFRLVSTMGVRAPRLYAGPLLCCGMPLSDAGLESEFRVHAARIHSAIAAAPRIIVGDPDCASTLRDRYRDVGYDLSARIVTVVGYLWEHRDALKRCLKPRDTSIVFHDSCHLGRVFGLYDEPRDLARLAIEGDIHEPFHKRAAATCSGAGGLLPVTSPDTARGIANIAHHELREASGSAPIVGTCTSALAHLAASNPGAETHDLVSLLASALTASRRTP
ncbi:MAG: (Fe-S)-binding protein [Deltaproteobacteria bacterium]|nr:(Fe-S)-binding protein [Deltaproteobacteria bacterium]